MYEKWGADFLVAEGAEAGLDGLDLLGEGDVAGGARGGHGGA